MLYVYVCTSLFDCTTSDFCLTIINIYLFIKTAEEFYFTLVCKCVFNCYTQTFFLIIKYLFKHFDRYSFQQTCKLIFFFFLFTFPLMHLFPSPDCKYISSHLLLTKFQFTPFLALFLTFPTPFFPLLFFFLPLTEYIVLVSLASLIDYIIRK